MKFFELFKDSKRTHNQKKFSRLHDKISRLLDKADEQEIILCTCIAGLMSRVAYVDFKIDANEKIIIKSALKKWTNFTEKEIEVISQIAIEEIKDLAGLENHKYCHPLNNILDNEQKYNLIETLFAIAAGDEEVRVSEIEEIRLINKGLCLEHKHFISAKATVLGKISSLKA